MPACRTWRPVETSVHQPPHTTPGSCTTCWRPCRNQVPVAGERCPECLDALSVVPWPTVRLALAHDPACPDEVVRLLATDTDLAVASAACTRLGVPLGTTWTPEAAPTITTTLEGGW